MPLKINIKSIFIYALYALLCVCADYAVRGVPSSFGLMFSMLVCGANIIVTPAIYALASIAHLDLTLSLISAFQAVFMGIITFLYRRTARKMRYEGIAFALIAMAPYIAFAPWLGVDGLIISNGYALRTIASAFCAVFGFFCFKTVYALLFRIERCRLKTDEILCIAVVYAVCGAGLFSLFGKAFYYSFSAFAVIVSARISRSPACVLTALAVSLPPSVVTLDLTPMTAFVVISALTLTFTSAGRFGAGIVCGGATALFSYFDGCYEEAVALVVLYALLLALFCILPSLPSAEKYENLKKRLTVDDILQGAAIDRNRRQTGEKLYRISEVFREIDCAFLALDENVNDEAARRVMADELKEKCCKNCERAKRCARSEVYKGFKKLIDAGCARGKVSLIDLPSEMTSECVNPSEVLKRLNGLLIEYRRYMTETENARSGRRLLAEQARGVAEVMKSCAVDLSRSSTQFKEREKIVKRALATSGIVCPELMIYGDKGEELSAVFLGDIDIPAIEKIISDALKRKFVLKDKICYDGQKSCLVFSAPPRYDAAFGVAFTIKNGEKISGDTHSVIKINDRSFLMALSDGMGSGEYARKVSEAAISLIESFYRAEMPEDAVLGTVNKLLSFNRDERFTCIDIVAVNLETGRADFVKIGSPAGIIMREGEIKVLESTSLPLGILDNLKPTVCTETLKDGDIVMFMSDGITSAFPSPADLYEFLQGQKPLNPQAIADKVLAAALDKSGHTAMDDMTVVCTRIFEN